LGVLAGELRARALAVALLRPPAAHQQEEDQQQDDRAGDRVSLNRMVVDEVGDGAGVDCNRHRRAQCSHGTSVLVL
jgi:hypothetical protein